jgi:hypothetical protein
MSWARARLFVKSKEEEQKLKVMREAALLKISIAKVNGSKASAGKSKAKSPKPVAMTPRGIASEVGATPEPDKGTGTKRTRSGSRTNSSSKVKNAKV